MTKMSRKNRGHQRSKSKKLRVFLYSLLTVLLLAFAAGGIFVLKVALQLPQWDPSSLNDMKQSSIIYDKNGNEIAQLHSTVNRLSLSSSQIPDIVKKTFVAVEDKRFYQEIGIDPIRIVSSGIQDLITGSAKQGASTITQQLARNAFIEDPTSKTLTRKVQEVIIAIQLERRYTKDEILTFYLNKIPLGESSYGIEAAAKTYFGKDVSKLDPAEVALLAGLPQASSGYDPYFHPNAAKTRRNIVLGVMRDAGIITAAQYNQSINESFTYVDTMIKTYGGPQKAVYATANYKYPSFVDYVVNELENKYNLTEDQINNGGLKIYTTVDPKIQTAAEDAFNDPANFPQSVDKSLVQGAMTIVEPSTGSIVAMVGGRNYQYGNFDRSWQAKRQPGSTIKPLAVYGPALEKGGYYPGTVLDDMPVTFDLGYGQSYSPVDDDTSTNGWKGLITMRYALEDSVNVYAVKLLSLIGVNTGWEFAKNNLGLPLTNQDKVLSLALGTCHVSTLDMASAYGVYANNGVRVTSHAIEKVIDSSGDTIITPSITRVRVMKETTAYLISDMLHSVVTGGTGYAANMDHWAVAGKTGTTSLPASYGNKNGNPDAWFAGYTPYYAGVVWMGYDSDPDGQHYLQQVYGGSYPARIWKKVMTVALQDKTVQTEFKRPAGIVSGSIDTKSGLLPSSLTPPQFIQTEIAAQGNFPTQVSNIWVQEYIKPNNVPRVFLNVPDRNPSIPWPSNEAPYRMPSNASLPGKLQQAPD
ncbi:penicillin-binding protein, 1A family [Desulfosporosinus acidiphilus SJ4]|uniref:Penicillin-binding protein 1A n=1 Tax=Desulfosporosinus acidiphilus (strain DSM 22704 / JCM 16185 / SJ4) TaxID=646529 RepID=I4D7B8_DESAJ|nr:PBP1A family penicillin-binding protein [Desulfosporosinus acidiphilus]AFM41692.1 penicillin-binding protein, 1A family [Desulfosporosinus acidiphilus SJ4]